MFPTFVYSHLTTVNWTCSLYFFFASPPKCPYCDYSTPHPHFSLFLALMHFVSSFIMFFLSSTLLLRRLHSLTHFSPPHYPSHPSQWCPLVFPCPFLFPASVEPLRLHRYSDGGLCRGCGLLLRHSAWRYSNNRCTHLLHLLHTTTAADLCRNTISHRVFKNIYVLA